MIHLLALELFTFDSAWSNGVRIRVAIIRHRHRHRHRLLGTKLRNVLWKS
jgi:hypothetical protein